MVDVRLQEQLTSRLEQYARELILVQAARGCDLLESLLSREGKLASDPDGRVLLGRVHLEGPGRELAQLVHEGTGLGVMIAVGDHIEVMVPFEADGQLEVPSAIATACYVRGDAFGGQLEMGDEHYVLAARALHVEGSGTAMVICGSRASKTNEALLDLTTIQAEIIELSEELQSDRRRAVADFLKVIRSIAKRIHLLALNASILSAQAGEHGRGFAVVAREIGELAERTRQSTTELEQEFLGQSNAVDVDRRSGGRRGTGI